MAKKENWHEKLWAAIDRMAELSGTSTSGLAKRAGLDATSFNKSKRYAPDGKPRWPSTESIAKILAATGATMAEFLELAEGSKKQIKAEQAAPSLGIPVIGFAQAGQSGFFDEEGAPAGKGWDTIHFPDIDKQLGRIYALELNGDSMQPLYHDGDRLIIAPHAPVRKGDRVVVKTIKGEVMAKELLRQTASRIELKSFNPHFADITLPVKDIAWIARILWVSQ